MSLLQEALDTCVALTRRVENLEYDKVDQALEITKLKRRVKKLVKRNKVRVLKLRRLQRVGISQRVDTSNDNVMDDKSNQERMIAEMDKDDDVVLMDDKDEDKKVEEAKVDESAQVQGRQAESQAEIYKIDMDHENKVLSMQKDKSEPAEVQEVVDVVTTAKLITKVVTAASETVTAASTIIPTVEPQVPAATLTVAPVRVVAAPSSIRKGVVIRDPEEESTTFIILPAETKSKDKGKGILIEEPKPLKKKKQIEMDEQYARKLHAELNKDINWDVAIDHVKLKAKEDPALDYFKGMSYDDIRPIFKAKFNSNVDFLLKTKEQMEEEENRALQTINETPAKKAAKRRKLNKEVEDIKRYLEIVPDENDDVYTEATPFTRKVPVVDYEIIERGLGGFMKCTCLNLEESKNYTWSSKGQELEATGIMRCADHNLYNHTSDFVSRKKVNTVKPKAAVNTTKVKAKYNDVKGKKGNAVKASACWYRVARTPQRNEVTERRNMTLIKAARTMLADSKLPTIFWAEAVNTACYVQNRVLVTKPHNKTSYELFHGRPPAISFLRPFGYPVTILNTIDHLGKFDGKADKGFFVGYSLNSKAFRVFNSRTRIVEENLHVRFSENTPNHVGSGPNWLFDIDALTKTMNYQPVVAQSNNFSCTKASNDAGNEKEPDKDYILLLLWTTDSPLSTTSKREEDSTNITNTVNTVTSNINAASSSGVNVVGTNKSINLPPDLNMPSLEDIGIFKDSHNDEDAFGAEVDFHNLDSTFQKNKEEVYVFQPPVFEDPDFPDKVYKVEKALCGLHQAPKAWYETLSTYLLEHRFKRGQIDKTLFIKRNKGDILLVRVYIDDIIFGSTKKEMCDAFEILMHEKFQMSSMGELTFFLGLQVKQKKEGIFTNQDKYVAKILKKYGFSDVKKESTPMEISKPLLKDEDGQEVDVHLYRSMIGSLVYLTSSMPDIMFDVCACAGYQVTPNVSHLHAVKGIFRYLKEKPFKSDGFKQIVDFHNTNQIKYALTVSPIIYAACIKQFWTTLKIITVNDDVQLQALIDGKKVVITEATIRHDLKLNDPEDIDVDAKVNLEDVTDADGKEVAEEMVEIITIAKIIIDELSTAGGELNAANEEPVSAAPTNITPAQPSKATKTNVDITTAPKAKGIVFHDMEESTTRTASSKPQVKDKGKAKLVEEVLKSRKAQIAIDEEVARRI
uniref:Uncharacterized mitochondrial protein AtMg00810-like n=1 Tax=Tanacetum cinerariifolium TaxID=118510 RepID=A0A6L2N2Z3_TANCI|nr:uncharacterized mitochondrial protein AtMg00810-like [Tanacetum cinerariifolium]